MPSPCSCAITTPRAYPDASVCMMNGLFQSGVFRTGSWVHTAFRRRKACSQSSDQSHWRILYGRSLWGRGVLVKTGVNGREEIQKPKKLSTTFAHERVGHFAVPFA